MNGKSLWPRLAGLPLVIEACEYDRLHAVLAYEFERSTTHVRLVGAGADGLGEDVSVFREDGSALHETRPSLPLEGEWTLGGFCDHLATLELWPQPPEWEVALRFRNWAFESAALDLALRQAGRSLHDVLGLEPQPVRFVNSLGLGKEPSIEPVRRRLARSPEVRLKLDAEATWTPALVDEVAATGAVDTIDFRVSTASRSTIRRRWVRCTTACSPRSPTPTWRTPTTGPRSRGGSAITSSACPTTRRFAAPSAYNQDDPPGGLPASPLEPRPEATGFRWAA
jgi:hypothetical protein